MEEVTEKLAKGVVIVDAEELDVIEVGDGEEVKGGRYWLSGRLLANDQYNFEVMKRVLLRIWKLEKEFTILRWENSDRILFSFEATSDRNRILNGSPWDFDRMLILLSKYDGLSDPSAIPLEKQAFCIRIQGLKPDNIN